MLVNDLRLFYNWFMIQKTYIFNSIEEMEEAAVGIRSNPAYSECGERVLLAWAQIWDKNDFARFRDSVHRLFHDCTTIGSNHYGSDDIMEGRLDGSSSDHSITLSFLFFKESSVSLMGIEPGIQQEERQGRQMCSFLDGLKDVKGVYFVPPDYFCSAEAVMAAGLRGHKDIPVFGIKTSLLPAYENFGYEKDREYSVHRLFILAFCGRRLNIRVHYNLGWTPVGRIMKVTVEENPFFVNEIDGRPATEIYNNYLGLKNNQIIPENLSEFPLIVLRGDMKISRIGVTGLKEGQLIFGAPVYPGERISLSYGNPDDLFSEVIDDCHEVCDFQPEGGLLLVCSNRLMLLKDREHEEIGFYKKHMDSPAVIYGYAEIYYLNGNGAELNSALVSVAFREDESEEGAPSPIACERPTVPENNDLIVPFSDRLSRFFKEISNDLLEAADDAERANRAKTAFYSAISHDIRTLLNSILGMNEMILKESHEENIREYAENADISGRMLLDLINDILDTEKLEAGKMELVPVEYRLNNMIKELSDMAKGPAANKGLELRVRTEGEFPAILIGDVKRLKQCALNLISNAVKYTETGFVTLTVKVWRLDETHVMLKVSVKDTGIGIRPEDIEKLSIPFERVDKARNHNIEGTGLGLNIVRNLLELMDSSLEIKSNYGEGSEFSFSVVQEVRKSDEDTGLGEDTGTVL
ncbi:MAG TPA: hypothetical protein DIS78_06085, partial [Lachnospiraceae bacterium]|nr:hypothetical protein [Lachnospiraceae bacterium]